MTSNAGLSKKVMQGAVWLAMLQWVSRFLGILSTLIVARILAPDSYGLIALLTIAIGLAENLLEFGSGSYLINKQDVRRVDFDTAWTINVLIYLILGVSIFVFSKQMSQFLNEPRLEVALQVFSFFFTLTGFRNIGMIELNKSLKFNVLFFHGFIQKSSSFAVTVYFAFQLHSYWALIYGMMTTRVADVLFSYVFSRYRPSFSLANFKEQWQYSKWMLSGNIIGYLRARSDSIIIGKFLGAEAIGLSTMASDLANLPAVEIIYPVLSPIYAGYAKLLHDKERLTNAFVMVNGLVATLMFPLLAGLWYLSDTIVGLALGEKWHAVSHILQFTIYSVFLQVFSEIFKGFLQVNGRVKWVAISNIVLMIFGISVLLYFTLVLNSGLEGVLLGRALIYFVTLVSFYFGVRGINNIKLLRLFRVWLRPFFSALVMVVILSKLELSQYNTPPILSLAANILLGGLIYSFLSVSIWYLAKKPEGGEAFVIQNLQEFIGKKLVKSGV
jgi:O-antigen/teichoic acid export membrane protein